MLRNVISIRKHNIQIVLLAFWIVLSFLYVTITHKSTVLNKMYIYEKNTLS